MQEHQEGQSSLSRIQFRKDHVELIYAQMRVELLVSVLLLGVVGVLVWGTLPPQLLAAWSFLAFATVGWRSLLIELWYRRSEAQNTNLFERPYLGGAFLSGAIWGCLGYLVFEYGDRTHLPYIMAALGCAAVVSFTSMQSSPRTFLAYALPLLLPTALLLLFEASLSFQLMAVLPVLLLLALSSSAQGFTGILEKAFRLSSRLGKLSSRC